MKVVKRKSLNERAQVMEWLEKWRVNLFLNEWYIDVEYTDEKDPDCSAYIRVKPYYFRATIFINPLFFESNEERQEKMIVHELCHCITEQSYLNQLDMLNGKLVTHDQMQRDREQLTQRITNIAFQGEWQK